MQILFYTEDEVQTYADKNGKYPRAPERCPHKGCNVPVEMSKHGFYRRYIITKKYTGQIHVRRFLCKACGQTVSMLPSFCIPYLQYGVEIIILTLSIAFTASTRYAEKKWPERHENMTRRHIIFYRDRIERNRKRIQLALNLISPGFIELIQITGDPGWTREFLKAVTRLNPLQFNAKFHDLTGESFMSVQNNVA